MKPPEVRGRSVLVLVTARPDMECLVLSAQIAVLLKGVKVSPTAVRAPSELSFMSRPDVAVRNVEDPANRVTDGLRE